MNKLIIDSRENSDLTNHVLAKAKEFNIPSEKQWLEVGDYIFNDVCFEAKSAYDFLQSITNKRLWAQMDNMDRNFPNNIVIVYGSFDSAFRQISKYSTSTMNKITQRLLYKKQFYSAMGRIILDTDCTLLWLKDAKTAGEVICVVCKMQPHNRPIYKPRIIKKISTTDLRVDMLATIKGVSAKKAKMLIDEFGSIMEIGETKTSELSMLKGIGTTLAERIHNVLNSENNQVI